MPDPDLRPRYTPHANVEELAPGHFLLAIPGGLAGAYRWAQLDDYAGLKRGQFRWKVPCSLELQARVSLKNLPGTWGFGFWNDPFTASLGLGGMTRHLPALPNAAWFFYASPPNFLSLRDDHPAQGFLAAAFSSPVFSSLLLVPGLLALPFLAWRPTARLLRRLARSLVKDDAVAVKTDFTQWHTYRLDLTPRAACFTLDGSLLTETPCVPKGPLALVLWIDNQYAAFTPDGRLKSGTLANPPAALEIQLIYTEK
jgi:hypothetical protein